LPDNDVYRFMSQKNVEFGFMFHKNWSKMWTLAVDERDH